MTVGCSRWILQLTVVWLLCLTFISASSMRKQKASSSSFQEIDETIKNLLSFNSDIKINSLTISGDSSNNAILELLNSPEGRWQLALKGDSGSFTINNSRVQVLEANPTEFILSTNKTSFKNVAVSNNLHINGVKQWKMVAQESFWNEPIGWNINSISKCGGIFMLGGYGITASKSLQKTFKDLEGQQVIRVSGSFHFIDAWSGETAFIKLINEDETFEYLWTENYDLSSQKNGINICGSDYVEAKLTTTFDFTFPYTLKTLTLAFGTTLQEDPYENSYGISNIQIFSL